MPRENVQSYPAPHGGSSRLPQRVHKFRLAWLVMLPETPRPRVATKPTISTYYLHPSDVTPRCFRFKAGKLLRMGRHCATISMCARGPPKPLAPQWSYENPNSGLPLSLSYAAFYAARLTRVWDRAICASSRKPGNFLRGWVTPNLDGGIQGAPERQHW